MFSDILSTMNHITNQRGRLHENSKSSLPSRSLVSRGSSALQIGRSQARFPIVSLEFPINIIVPAALWP